MTLQERIIKAIKGKKTLVKWTVEKGNITDALTISGQILRNRELLSILGGSTAEGRQDG